MQHRNAAWGDVRYHHGNEKRVEARVERIRTDAASGAAALVGHGSKGRADREELIDVPQHHRVHIEEDDAPVRRAEDVQLGVHVLRRGAASRTPSRRDAAQEPERTFSYASLDEHLLTQSLTRSWSSMLSSGGWSEMGESGGFASLRLRVGKADSVLPPKVQQRVDQLQHKEDSLRALLPDAVQKLILGYELRTFYFEIIECLRKLAIGARALW